MPFVEVLQVSAVSSPNSWTLGAGTDKVAAVQSPDDADTTYVAATPSGSDVEQQYALANPIGIGPNDTILSVKVISRVRKVSGAAGMYRHAAVLSGNVSPGGSKVLTTSYADYQDAFSAKPGGGSWSLADVQNLEVRVVAENGSVGERLTTLRVEVTYEPAPIAAKRHLGVGIGIRIGT